MPMFWGGEGLAYYRGPNLTTHVCALFNLVYMVLNSQTGKPYKYTLPLTLTYHAVPSPKARAQIIVCTAQKQNNQRLPIPKI